MAASMDSDEEDSFVVIGKQVEQLDDDEPSKKKVSVHDLPVKDEKGRQRFHGAFTGGFSAGYFNSVGTKEGWAPSTFVSSRQSRTEHVSQRPEDFMDDDDFGEHGIAPRKIATSDSYTSEERQRKRKDLASAIVGDSVGSGESTLLDLVIPDSTPIGIRLLRKMGWKEGQGVGPRISSKNRKKKRVYGCALPQSSESDNEGSDDDFLSNITFAPKDCNPVSFDAKDNTHGIGYRGLNASVALPSGHINLFEPPAIGSSRQRGKRGIKGQGFGVGALEEEDDDIYAVDHLSNYDMTMDKEDEDHFSGWTAPKGLKQGYNSAHVGYVGKLLEGFTLSTKPLKPGKIYPPPNLPSYFKPVHRFKGPVVDESISGLNKTEKVNSSSASERALMLGETPVIVDSVFDLVSAKDKEKMLKAKMGNLLPDHEDVSNESHNKQKPVSSTNKTKSSRWDSMIKKSKDNSTCNVDNQDSNITGSVSVSSIPPNQKTAVVVDTNLPTASNKPLFQGSITGYKPFAKNPEKQERYEKYLSLVNLGHKDAYLQVSQCHLTEWERERERDEFVRAAKLYRPLSSMMASRFTTAKFDDETESVDIPKEDETDKTDKEKAAEMKMFGQLTRDNLEWHPDKTLCKRFNVPDPYPGSSIVGLPTVKRDKYSVYNFLSFPSQGFESQSEERKPLAIEPKKDMESVREHDVDKKNTSKISFNLKKKPSIFNVLFEEESGSKSSVKQMDLLSDITNDQSERDVAVTTEDTNELETTKLQENVPKTASIDLYRAIFQNSDSEDESSDKNSEEDNEDKPAVTIPLMESNNVSEIPSLSSGNVPTNSVPDTNYRLPGDGTKIETLTERLSASPKPVSVSSSSDVEMFGPALPDQSIDEKLKHAVKEHQKSFTPKHRFKKKHKEKYEERHKKKKKEKSTEKYKSNDRTKHKKSKQKKNKGKKSKKHKKKSTRRSGYDSDESSSDSDDTEVVEKSLDIEILERMRGGPTSRNTAADFM